MSASSSESGARAPLIGGRFMAWWGLLVTIGWTAQHLAVNGVIGDGNTIFGIIWMTFGIVGALGQVLLARSMPAKAGQGSAGNRASRTVWGAGAFAILSMVVGVAVLANTGGRLCGVRLDRSGRLCRLCLRAARHRRARRRARSRSSRATARSSWSACSPPSCSIRTAICSRRPAPRRRWCCPASCWSCASRRPQG